MTRGKLFNIIGLFLGTVMVVVITYLTAAKLSLISGFPKGVDAYAH
jgi:ABC-type transport system involved in multi-copper enzyme maturation permease subunit